MTVTFEWDEEKDLINQEKHGVSFKEAQHAFFDPGRIIIHDPDHSENEDRWFCIGRVGHKIMTVRYTVREQTVRLIGAGYWRKGRRIYEQKN